MQHFWLTIRFWLSQLLLKPFLKVTPLPPGAWAALKPDETFCFIVDGFHAADRTAIEKTLIQASKIPIDNVSFVYLASDPDKDMPAHTLACIQSISAEKRIILSSVFWGRKSTINSHWLYSYFSQAHGPISLIRRALTILVQIRQVNCHIIPLECQTLTADDLIQARHTLYTVRESVTGPDLSHKRILAKKVLQSEEVQHCITEWVAKDGITRIKANKKALKLYREIAADYSYTTLRFLDRLLSIVWQKIYQGIEIHNFDNVTDIAHNHQVIYTPCHRSHIDYLLLSYAIYHQGLMPPHIAAGINLNLPVVGTILRKGGAFFIRRQFREQKLYRAVFESYVSAMIELGIPLEYFIEGGRSRTGLLLPSKPGMLAMTVRAALTQADNSKRKPIAIVPVYIGYEKLLESHTYINELYGSKKEKESIRSLFAARKYLLRNYGRAYVNFAEPIYLDRLCQQVKQDLQSDTASDANLTTLCVTRLSQDIPTAINSAAIITPANLIATALLSSSRHALLSHQLEQQMQTLQGICRINHMLDLSHLESSLADIKHCQELDLIQTQQQNWGTIFSLDQKGEVNATFLRNNTLHNFIIASIIAAVLIRHPCIHKQKIVNTCRRLLPFIQSELHLNICKARLNDKINEYLAWFVERKLLSVNNEQYKTFAAQSESFYQLSLLAGSSKAAIERFYITAQCLLQTKDAYYTRHSLETDCIKLAQQLALLHDFHAPDFFDKNLFRTFIAQLIQTTVIGENEQGLLTCKRRLSLSAELTSQVLSYSAQRNIQQLAHRIHAFNAQTETLT